MAHAIQPLYFILFLHIGSCTFVQTCVASCTSEENAVEQAEDKEVGAARFGLMQTKSARKSRFHHAEERSDMQAPESSPLMATYTESPIRDRLQLIQQLFPVAPAMVAAFRLKLWDAIPTPSGATFDEIVRWTNTTEKGMDVLLEAMLNLGTVSYNKDTKRFHNEYLKDSSSNDGDDAEWKTQALMESVAMQRQLYYLADSVREGRAVGLTEVLGDYESIYEARADLPDVARDWDPWMDSHNGDIAQRMAFIYQLPSVVARIGENSTSFKGHVLDWCGNDGKNAIKLAKNDPTMRLTVLDLPAQVAKAAHNIEAASLQDQIDTKGVDLLVHEKIVFEHRYDAVFMIHMIREWTDADLTRFVETAHSNLNPGGVLVIFPFALERHLGDFDHYTPNLAVNSFHSLYMLASAAHTSYPKFVQETKTMLGAVGFVNATFHFGAFPEPTSFMTAVRP